MPEAAAPTSVKSGRRDMMRASAFRMKGESSTTNTRIIDGRVAGPLFVDDAALEAHRPEIVAPADERLGVTQEQVAVVGQRL